MSHHTAKECAQNFFPQNHRNNALFDDGLLKIACTASFSRLLFTLSQWALVAALAWTTTPSTVGAYGIGLAIVTPLFIFTNTGMRADVLTRPHLSSDQIRLYVMVRSVTALLALAIVLIVALIFYREIWLLIICLALYKAVEASVDIHQGILQRLGLYASAGLALSARAVINLVVFLSTLLASGEVTLALMAMTVVGAMLIPLLEARWIRIWCSKHQSARRTLWERLESAWPNRNDIQGAGKLLLQIMPLGLGSLVLASAHSIPRFFVEGMYGLEAAGVFTALYYVLHAMSLVVASGSQAILPQLTELSQGGASPKLGRYVVIVSCAFAVGGAMAAGITYLYGGELIDLIYGEPYNAHSWLLVLMLIAAVPRMISTFIAQVAIIGRMFWRQFVISLFAPMGMVVAFKVLASAGDLNSSGVALIAGYGLACFVRVLGLPLSFQGKPLIATAFRARRAEG